MKELETDGKDGSKILKKKGQLTVRCSWCKQQGHNKRTSKDSHSSTNEDGGNFVHPTNG